MSGSLKIIVTESDLPQCNGKQSLPGTEFISVLCQDISEEEMACAEGTRSPTRILIVNELFLDLWPG